MTAPELMLAALTNGLEDDATVSAALDAIREESACSLLAAVLEVARVHRALHDSRDVQAAHEQLSPAGPVRAALRRAIVAECLDLLPGQEALVVVIPGDRYPTASRPSHQPLNDPAGVAIVSVGALWVKRVASRLLLEREQRKAARPRRRSS